MARLQLKSQPVCDRYHEDTGESFDKIFDIGGA